MGQVKRDVINYMYNIFDITNWIQVNQIKIDYSNKIQKYQLIQWY